MLQLDDRFQLPASDGNRLLEPPKKIVVIIASEHERYFSASPRSRRAISDIEKCTLRSKTHLFPRRKRRKSGLSTRRTMRRWDSKICRAERWHAPTAFVAQARRSSCSWTGPSLRRSAAGSLPPAPPLWLSSCWARFFTAQPPRCHCRVNGFEESSCTKRTDPLELHSIYFTVRDYFSLPKLSDNRTKP